MNIEIKLNKNYWYARAEPAHMQAAGNDKYNVHIYPEGTDLSLFDIVVHVKVFPSCYLLLYMWLSDFSASVLHLYPAPGQL